ncbi:MAG: SWIM zinc finger family protein [Candidatus Bathyarchaeia archaeon]
MNVTQISIPVAEQQYYVCKWEVPSFSDPSKAYTVSKTVSGDYQCSCPRWTKSKLYRRQQCKHIDTVLGHLPPSPPPQNKRQPRAKPRAPKAPVRVTPESAVDPTETGRLFGKLFADEEVHETTRRAKNTVEA